MVVLTSSSFGTARNSSNFATLDHGCWALSVSLLAATALNAQPPFAIHRACATRNDQNLPYILGKGGCKTSDANLAFCLRLEPKLCQKAMKFEMQDSRQASGSCFGRTAHSLQFSRYADLQSKIRLTDWHPSILKDVSPKYKNQPDCRACQCGLRANLTLNCLHLKWCAWGYAKHDTEEHTGQLPFRASGENGQDVLRLCKADPSE